MTFTRLLVVGNTHPPESVAAHLASSGALRVEAGTGNHVPASTEGTAVWIKTSGATRFHNAGVELGLLSPGPDWLATVPGHFLGRKLVCTTLGELAERWSGPGIFRLPEQQYGVLGFEKLYTDPGLFIQQVTKYHRRLPELADGVHVTASAPVDYTDRYRVFIADGEVSATTRVVANQDPAKRTDAYEGDEPDQTKAAEHFARKVLAATVWHQPPGFCIEVGTTSDGSWQLIKAGPSWAADFHDANPAGAVSAILAGQAPGHEHWKWVPDDLFKRIIFRAWLPSTL